MAKTPRISVPIPPDISRKLRQMTAENGRSIAANFADLAVVGASKTDLAKELAELRSAIEHANSGADSAQLLRELSELRVQVAQMHPMPATERAPAVEAVSLNDIEAKLIFEQVFFASFLAQEVAGADMPGKERKPGGFYVAQAKAMARTALKNFLSQRRAA